MEHSYAWDMARQHAQTYQNIKAESIGWNYEAMQRNKERMQTALDFATSNLDEALAEDERNGFPRAELMRMYREIYDMLNL